MRLIDADEIKYETHEKLGLGIDYSINESDVSYVVYKHQIDSMPTIDPVKHGRWGEKTHCNAKVIEEWQSCKCSVCGRYDTRPYLYYFSEPNFCSWCGAKMDEVVKDE